MIAEAMVEAKPSSLTTPTRSIRWECPVFASSGRGCSSLYDMCLAYPSAPTDTPTSRRGSAGSVREVDPQLDRSELSSAFHADRM